LPGEFLVILGPSGCGKSTLLRIIAGLEPADFMPETELLLDGKAITGPGPDRGFVFQSFSSFPWLTAKQNVEFGLRFFIKDGRERESRALEYLKLVGLLDQADSYPKNLSGGQQQRIAIARTLATRPQLLMMDEPYAALDAQNRELQQAELIKIWRSTRPTILFVTHDITEAAFLGQRVIVFGERPAGIIEEVNTEKELENKIRDKLLSPDSTEDASRRARLSRDFALSMESLSMNERGSWVREQPEFYELVAKLKHILPRPTRD
jgi:NitT/TauT family transport system ATP-binding protein